MNLRTIIADFLIVSAILLLGYTYWPVISLYTPLTPKIEATSYSITIPKINAIAPIIANVDPWNKNNYEQALEKGVAQAEGFADFEDHGTVFLFAHSSLPPWKMTRSNTAFLRLNELEEGDKIIVNKFNQTYTYVVSDKQELSPSQVDQILNETADQLILQTCTPIGTDFRRLLIYATPVEE